MPNVYISGVKKCDFVQNLALFLFNVKKTKTKKKPTKKQPESIDCGPFNK